MNIKEKSIVSIIAILAIGCVIWALGNSMDQSEIVECNQWKEQSTQYAGFFLAEWQAEQCTAHHININAPVK